MQTRTAVPLNRTLLERRQKSELPVACSGNKSKNTRRCCRAVREVESALHDFNVVARFTSFYRNKLHHPGCLIPPTGDFRAKRAPTSETLREASQCTRRVFCAPSKSIATAEQRLLYICEPTSPYKSNQRSR